VASIVSVQFGAALSVGLFPKVGTAGTAWLRLSAGAVIFLLIARPPVRSINRRDLPVVVGLGLATGLITVAFLFAISRIPLGTAVAIEFLGPLTVAVVRAGDRRLLIWPALAFGGVLLLTQPWSGASDLVGVAAAAVAAACWGTYIVLTANLGTRMTGIKGLSLTIPIAALATAAVGVPQAWGNITPGVVAAAFGLALLLPVLPFSLEMLALRRLTASAFGTLMALEPAVGLILGAILLAQRPDASQLVGIVLVVVAGMGAARRGSIQAQDAAAISVAD